MNRSAWQRWALLIALFALGILYVLAYVFFRANSRDFVAELFNQRARAYAAKHPVEPPATLVFTSGSQDLAMLGSGWYRAAPEGTWSSMEDSSMSFALPRIHSAVGVKLVATPFVSRRHKQINVHADVDGHTVGEWQRRWNDPQPLFEFCIPADTRVYAPRILHIQVQKPAVPLNVRAGGDSRLLGLLLHSIEFSAGCSAVQSG